MRELVIIVGKGAITSGRLQGRVRYVALNKVAYFCLLIGLEYREDL